MKRRMDGWIERFDDYIENCLVLPQHWLQLRLIAIPNEVVATEHIALTSTVQLQLLKWKQLLLNAVYNVCLKSAYILLVMLKRLSSVAYLFFFWVSSCIY